MKVSQHLPHFHEPHLLISAGKTEAMFFLAHSDKVEQVHSVKIKKPQYTDREGRFDKRGGGILMGTGSVYENKDDEQIRLAIKSISESTESLVSEHAIQTIYLYCPTYLSNQVEDGFSTKCREMIEYIFYGNYHQQHPFVLLSKIQEYLRQQQANAHIEPIKGEAMKILKTKTVQ